MLSIFTIKMSSNMYICLLLCLKWSNLVLGSSRNSLLLFSEWNNLDAITDFLADYSLHSYSP